ncbi:CPBP family glutamic-type intramembrane protease [Couchioplanes caeruleus]|uniref:CPBP family glutamic-type intramembrane protease n=1 Tax=Couchioplanes caeruleus TaxID=56438 RepID=UPI00201B9CD8|nr:CPBP family glutamic-type intramembrane protease [Couchioplanes caeruleus]UQU67603.1 CPBP family glutamic-type intramembrane protease [Couchioplanes caeruleus]
MPSTTGPRTASAPATSSIGRSRRRRSVEAGAFVAVWIAAGYLLTSTSNGYLLLGIPLTVAFQVIVRRRPLRALFAAGTSRFTLDRRGAALALALAVVPGWYAVRSLTGHDWVTTGWYAAATAGAACAAFASRARSVSSTLRTAALPIAVGAGGMTLVYGALHVMTGTPVPVSAALGALPAYIALYFPAAFLLEEVTFRGALDAHVHHDGETRGWQSAVFTSTLWGLWHLPVSHGLPWWLQVIELVVVHVVLGVPLSMAWRRSRNLAAPAFRARGQRRRPQRRDARPVAAGPGSEGPSSTICRLRGTCPVEAVGGQGDDEGTQATGTTPSGFVHREQVLFAAVRAVEDFWVPSHLRSSSVARATHPAKVSPASLAVRNRLRSRST